MVAYMAGTGALSASFLNETLHLNLPDWVAGLAATLLFALMIYCGTQTVDRFNRLLMLGLIVSYFALVAMGKSHVNAVYLQQVDWKAAAFVVPVMIISFGFHNLIPSMTSYFQGDARKLRQTILFGSLIPLLCYLVWEWLILGLIPLEGEAGFKEALDTGGFITQSLKSAVNSPWVITFAECFAFFAIVTSFLGVALSFVDFLSDGLQMPKVGMKKVLLLLLVLAPPFILAIFLSADLPDGPHLCRKLWRGDPVWHIARSNGLERTLSSADDCPSTATGRRIALALIILVATLVIILQLYQDLGGMK